MTKKDYIMLARLLRETKPLGHGQTMHFWHGMIITLSDRLKAEHPAFDAVRFLKACGHDPHDVLKWEIVNYHRGVNNGETESDV